MSLWVLHCFYSLSWCNNGMFAIGQSRRLLKAKTARPAGLNYGDKMLPFGQGSLFAFLYFSGSSLMYLGDWFMLARRLA